MERRDAEPASRLRPSRSSYLEARHEAPTLDRRPSLATERWPACHRKRGRSFARRDPARGPAPPTAAAESSWSELEPPTRRAVVSVLAIPAGGLVRRVGFARAKRAALARATGGGALRSPRARARGCAARVAPVPSLRRAGKRRDALDGGRAAGGAVRALRTHERAPHRGARAPGAASGHGGIRDARERYRCGRGGGGSLLWPREGAHPQFAGEPRSAAFLHGGRGRFLGLGRDGGNASDDGDLRNIGNSPPSRSTRSSKPW